MKSSKHCIKELHEKIDLTLTTKEETEKLKTKITRNLDNYEEKLSEINNLHPSLKFTIEREVNGSIPFLDMKIINESGRLSSTWYNKPTDTGLIMNFHALAPKRYKRSVVSGFIHRIHRAGSTWNHFNKSLQHAKLILKKNNTHLHFMKQS